MSKEPSIVPLVLGPLICGAIISGVLSYWAGRYHGRTETEDRAVKAGAAYREVDQDAGYVWIVWRKKP